jgi:hypothetical protein
MTWIIAAILLRDAFILGVNAAGFCFACIQLLVIAYIKFWVGEASPSSMSIEKSEKEEGGVIIRDMQSNRVTHKITVQQQ